MWVPIALSRDIPPGTTRAVILGGRELVVWRTETGSIQVWEDRCPHRGMRLSFGFVRGEALNCLYHGWEYGAGASCHRIPAHPNLTVPATIRANAFASLETATMVWTSTGAEAPPPDLAPATPLATVAVDAPIATILALCATATHADAQIFEGELDGIAVQIGWHEVGPDRTMLHASLPGAADPAGALRALRKLRDTAEAQSTRAMEAAQ